MIGKVIGAFVGDKIAKQTSGMNGATGAALGVLATALLRRVTLPAMLAIAAGGYAAKKLSERKDTGIGPGATRDDKSRRPTTAS